MIRPATISLIVSSPIVHTYPTLAAALFKLLGEHYVERLGVMVMYNPPLIFWGAWNALSPLLPPVTKKKVLVIGANDHSQV